MKFAIITPTVGRDSLRSALASVRWQTCRDLVHLVIGDGPMLPFVKLWCEASGAEYHEIPANGGCFGAAARNKGMELVEQGGLADYLIFLDDDNILFPTAVERYKKAALANQKPPLMSQQVVFQNQFNPGWLQLPRKMPPEQMDWDSMNGCYRADVVAGLRWKCDYNHDFFLATEAMERAGTNTFLEVDGLIGVHF